MLIQCFTCTSGETHNVISKLFFCLCFKEFWVLNIFHRGLNSKLIYYQFLSARWLKGFIICISFSWIIMVLVASRQRLVLVLVCCIIPIICFGLDGPIQSDHGWIGSQTSNLRKLNFEFTLSKLSWDKRVEVWKRANNAWQKYIFYNFTGINVTRTGNLENNLNGIFYYHIILNNLFISLLL